jgi:outer membrane immunogenic protein
MRSSFIGRLALLRAAALILTGGSAKAADLPPPPASAPVYRAVPVVPVFTWTGCYVGANVGGGWASTHAYDTSGVITGFAGAPVLNSDLGSQTTAGVVGGGQLGCDYQRDRFVIGIQGVVDASGMKGSIAEPAGNFTIDSSIPWFATVTARAGITVVPTGLLYVKAGGAFIKDNLSMTITSAGSAFLGVPPGLAASAGYNASGWTAGGGFEWAFADKWSVFAEYDYLNFGTPTINFTSAGTVVVPATFQLGVQKNVSVFMVGINARLGPGAF